MQEKILALSAEQQEHIVQLMRQIVAKPEDLDENHIDGQAGHHLVRAMSGVTNWKDEADNSAGKELYQEYQELLGGASAAYSEPVPGFQKGDCLLIVDMQNDFVPAADAPDGGRFGVAEGASAGTVIVEMTAKAAAAGAMVVATRDYHPWNHRSFMTHTGPGGPGPFPAHCVQGSKGSYFFPPIAKSLDEARSAGGDVRVVFKGLHPGVDSFGGLRYGEKYFSERKLGGDVAEPLHMSQGCCMLEWTGSFCLECSNLVEDINAPPDVMAVFGRKSLKDELADAGIKRLFVTGLALDFCVLDSALNASAAGLAQEGVYLVVDAARAAYIPGVGTFGSGFLSDPAEVVKKTVAQGVKLIHNANIGS